jgi:ribosomal protein S18 acetylase RimI-like enzyme
MTARRSAATAPLQIRRAGPADAPALALLIAESFHPLAVCEWLIPDANLRRRVLPAYFRIFVDHGLAHGYIDAVTDLSALAIWLPVPVPPPEEYDAHVAAIVGEALERFRTFDELLAANRPDSGAHDHLAFLAVHPERQGNGLGSALLTHHHRHLDRQGTAAHVEASSPGSRDLYRRHGYRPHGEPYRLPAHGPSLWPLWREPRQRGDGR